MTNQIKGKDNLNETKPVPGKAKRVFIHLWGTIALGSLIALIYASGIMKNASPDGIRDLVISWGHWGALGYLALFTFVPLTLFPDAVLAIASGMAFGMGKGFVLTWLGALLGGSLAFWLARLIGQEAMESVMSRLGHKPHPVPMMKGFLSILLLRLVPLVPFDVVSYGAGLSHVRYRDYLAATGVGIIPGVCVYVNLGDKLFDCNSVHFYWAIALLVALTVVSSLGVQWLKKYRHKNNVHEDPQ